MKTLLQPFVSAIAHAKNLIDAAIDSSQDSYELPTLERLSTTFEELVVRGKLLLQPSTSWGVSTRYARTEEAPISMGDVIHMNGRWEVAEKTDNTVIIENLETKKRTSISHYSFRWFRGDYDGKRGSEKMICVTWVLLDGSRLENESESLEGLIDKVVSSGHLLDLADAIKLGVEIGRLDGRGVDRGFFHNTERNFP